MDLTILVAAGLLVVISGVAAVYAESSAVFRDRLPPITDDEFMARCPPGTDRRIALGVRRLVSEQTGVPYEQIHPSTRFVDDLGMG